MAYHASYRFARISPTKVRRVVDLVRGKPVGEAIEQLRFVPNRGARMLEKLLKSVMANAEDQGARKVDEMIVTQAQVNEGPRMKRILPRARGMAFPLLKRMSHLHVEIDREQATP